MSLPKRKKSKKKIISPFRVNNRWSVTKTMRPGPNVTESVKTTYLLYKETRRIYRNYQNLLKIRQQTHVCTSHLREPRGLQKREKHFSKNKKRGISRLNITTRRKLRQYNRYQLYLSKRKLRFITFRFLKFLNRYNHHHHNKSYLEHVRLVSSLKELSAARVERQGRDYVPQTELNNHKNNINIFLNQ